MSKLRKSARGKECTVRIEHVCNWNNETVVLAHLNSAGMGMKEKDLFGARACSDCHAWLDGGYSKTHTKQERDLMHFEAMKRTQEQYIEEALICLP